MGYNLVRGLFLVHWRFQESFFGDIAIIEKRRKLGSHNLVCDTLFAC